MATDRRMESYNAEIASNMDPDRQQASNNSRNWLEADEPRPNQQSGRRSSMLSIDDLMQQHPGSIG